MVWFLGSALPDTIYAGPGTVQIKGAGSGHAGPAGAGAYRGQLAAVERLEPQAAERLGEALRAAGNRVALVAWDYDAACALLPRVARADWVRPGTRGLYEGVLRPREYWAAGIPTLDVFAPEFVPYPWVGGIGARPGRDSSSRWATAEQLFEYLSALPASFDGPGEYSERSSRWMQQWAKEHPALAALEPIAGTIALSRGTDLRERASFHRIKSEIAGTWRLELTLAGGDTLVFFARTSETPISAAYDSVEVFRLPDDAPTRSPISYNLYSRFTREAASLDSLHGMDDPGTREGYFELVIEPLLRSVDSTVWRGSLPVHQIARLLFTPPVSPLWMQDRFSKRDGARFQGRFILTRDGRLRGEERLLRDGVPLLTIRAERMDEVRFPGERPPRRR